MLSRETFWQIKNYQGWTINYRRQVDGISNIELIDPWGMVATQSLRKLYFTQLVDLTSYEEKDLEAAMLHYVHDKMSLLLNPNHQFNVTVERDPSGELCLLFDAHGLKGGGVARIITGVVGAAEIAAGTYMSICSLGLLAPLGSAIAGAGAETLRHSITAEDKDINFTEIGKVTLIGGSTGLLTAGVGHGVGAGMNAVLGKEVAKNLAQEAAKGVTKELAKEVAMKAARKAASDVITAPVNAIINAGAEAIKKGDMEHLTKKFTTAELFHDIAKSVAGGQINQFVEFAGQAGAQVIVEKAIGKTGAEADKAVKALLGKGKNNAFKMAKGAVNGGMGSAASAASTTAYGNYMEGKAITENMGTSVGMAAYTGAVTGAVKEVKERQDRRTERKKKREDLVRPREEENDDKKKNDEDQALAEQKKLMEELQEKQRAAEEAKKKAEQIAAEHEAEAKRAAELEQESIRLNAKKAEADRIANEAKQQLDNLQAEQNRLDEQSRALELEVRNAEQKYKANINLVNELEKTYLRLKNIVGDFLTNPLKSLRGLGKEFEKATDDLLRARGKSENLLADFEKKRKQYFDALARSYNGDIEKTRDELAILQRKSDELAQSLARARETLNENINNKLKPLEQLGEQLQRQVAEANEQLAKAESKFRANIDNAIKNITPKNLEMLLKEAGKNYFKFPPGKGFSFKDITRALEIAGRDISAEWKRLPADVRTGILVVAAGAAVLGAGYLVLGAGGTISLGAEIGGAYVELATVSSEGIIFAATPLAGLGVLAAEPYTKEFEAIRRSRGAQIADESIERAKREANTPKPPAPVNVVPHVVPQSSAPAPSAPKKHKTQPTASVSPAKNPQPAAPPAPAAPPLPAAPAAPVRPPVEVVAIGKPTEAISPTQWVQDTPYNHYQPGQSRRADRGMAAAGGLDAVAHFQDVADMIDGPQVTAQNVYGKLAVAEHGGCDRPTIGAQGTEDDRHIACAVEKARAQREAEREKHNKKRQPDCDLPAGLECEQRLFKQRKPDQDNDEPRKSVRFDF